MGMRKFLIEEERGAATVDWVVLGAACVGMALAVSEVTASAMESLSHDVRAELTNTDPSRNYFDEIMTLAVFSEYTAFSDDFSTGWYDGGLDGDGLNWAQAAYDVYADMDDAALLDQYEYHYEVAVDGDPLEDGEDAKSVDYVAVAEHVLNDRGIDLPGDNLSAADIRTALENGGFDD